MRGQEDVQELFRGCLEGMALGRNPSGSRARMLIVSATYRHDGMACPGVMVLVWSIEYGAEPWVIASHYRRRLLSFFPRRWRKAHNSALARSRTLSYTV